MKTFASALFLGIALGLLTAHANDKSDSTQPSRQALIVRTPEEKAKAEALIPSYPLQTCLVSGDKLGSMGEPIDALYGDRLIRFCCKGCVKSFNKNPDKYLRKLDSPEKPAS